MDVGTLVTHPFQNGKFFHSQDPVFCFHYSVESYTCFSFFLYHLIILWFLLDIQWFGGFWCCACGHFCSRQSWWVCVLVHCHSSCHHAFLSCYFCLLGPLLCLWLSCHFIVVFSTRGITCQCHHNAAIKATRTRTIPQSTCNE